MKTGIFALVLAALVALSTSARAAETTPPDWSLGLAVHLLDNAVVTPTGSGSGGGSFLASAPRVGLGMERRLARRVWLTGILAGDRQRQYVTAPDGSGPLGEPIETSRTTTFNATLGARWQLTEGRIVDPSLELLGGFLWNEARMAENQGSGQSVVVQSYAMLFAIDLDRPIVDGLALRLHCVVASAGLINVHQSFGGRSMPPVNATDVKLDLLPSLELRWFF